MVEKDAEFCFEVNRPAVWVWRGWCCFCRSRQALAAKISLKSGSFTAIISIHFATAGVQVLTCPLVAMNASWLKLATNIYK